jgi:hypothetical protein
VNILDALDDPNLFKPWVDAPSWRPWRTALAAMFGLLPLPDRRLFKACTARTRAPRGQVSEFWAIIGRRGGKTFILSLVAVWLAFFRDYRPYRQAGELITILLVAGDRAQCRTAFRYIRGIVRGIPMLERQVVRETSEELELANGVLIEVVSNSYRLIRGRTVSACLCDEAAFWHVEGTKPAEEVLAAVRPAMALIPDSLLMIASTPYARRGPVWTTYQRHFGQNRSDILVWRASTRTMNPALPQRVVTRAFEDDPASAASEYDAEFRTDLQSLIDRETVLELVDVGVRERPPERHRRYAGFIDPSGGRQDSFAMAVAHREGDRVVLDLIRERRAPFNPDATTREFAGVFRAYGISTIGSDRYAAEWVTAQFREQGIRCEPPVRSKSDYYVELLPVLNSGRVRLLDNEVLVGQLCSLERRTSRVGKDLIDHPPHGRDDVINAAAGALVTANEVRAAIQQQRLLGV